MSNIIINNPQQGMFFSAVEDESLASLNASDLANIGISLTEAVDLQTPPTCKYTCISVIFYPHTETPF